VAHVRWKLVSGVVLLAVAGSVAAAQAAPNRHSRRADEIDPKLGVDVGELQWTGMFRVRETDRTHDSGGGFDNSGVTVIDTTVKIDATTTTASSTFTYDFQSTSTDLQCASTDTTQLAGSYRGKVKGGRVVDQDYSGGVHHFSVPNVDYTVTGTYVATDCQGTSSTPKSHPWDGTKPGQAVLGYSVKAPGKPGATELQGSYSEQSASGNLMRTTQYKWKLNLCGELSGSQWTDRYPDSNKLSDLSEPFRDDVTKFLGALGDAHRVFAGRSVRTPVRPFIETTYRPDPRAYLMHYSFRVAGGKPHSTQFAKMEAADVPVYKNSGTDPHFKQTGVAAVPICWVHRDPDGNLDKKASKQAAVDMKTAYHINPFGAAFPSNHSAGKAIDMNVFWGSVPIVVKNAAGVDQTVKTGQDLFAVAATYGVRKHFGQCGGLGKPDPPHWSLTGC